MHTINALVLAELVDERVAFQLAQVKEMLPSTCHNSFGAVTYQVRQQKQTLKTKQSQRTIQSYSVSSMQGQ